MTTLTIPLVTLPVGARDFGPGNVVDTESSILLTIDRTVTGGLNSLTGASVVQVDVMQSNDGGVTWRLQVGGSMPGGALGPVSSLQVDLWPGTSRKVKATVTVSGPSSVAVAGTLVTS